MIGLRTKAALGAKSNTNGAQTLREGPPGGASDAAPPASDALACFLHFLHLLLPAIAMVSAPARPYLEAAPSWVREAHGTWDRRNTQRLLPTSARNDAPHASPAFRTTRHKSG